MTALQKLDLSYCSEQDLQNWLNVYSGVLYFVHIGRNAWHTTWIQRYTTDCMHADLDHAKAHAENLRNNGTRVYVQELPCIVFETSGSNPNYVAVEINTPNPFSKFTFDSSVIVDTGLDFEQVGIPSQGILNAFKSKFNYAGEEHDGGQTDNTILLEDTLNLISNSGKDNFYKYISVSNGAKYYLGWDRSEITIDNNHVIDVSNKCMKLKEVLFSMLSKSPRVMIEDRIKFLRQTEHYLTEDRSVSEIVDLNILEKIPAAILCKMNSSTLVSFMKSLEKLIEAGATSYEVEAYIDSIKWIPFGIIGSDKWLQRYRVIAAQSDGCNVIDFPLDKT
ncbi:hypothetical protein [Cobetia sp. 5-11-6-3]|uniref:hypothetical protein n=1 Tax=Cobetia sp. 5-11-6-3 TaxID=2737458 RepID=UPI00159669CC|nr:hypothetical protein [Cobetia sp. 5-11-6-3]